MGILEVVPVLLPVLWRTGRQKRESRDEGRSSFANPTSPRGLRWTGASSFAEASSFAKATEDGSEDRDTGGISECGGQIAEFKFGISDGGGVGGIAEFGVRSAECITGGDTGGIPEFKLGSFHTYGGGMRSRGGLMPMMSSSLSRMASISSWVGSWTWKGLRVSAFLAWSASNLAFSRARRWRERSAWSHRR